VIRYTEGDFADEVRRLTGGRGGEVVYDGVGRSTFDASLRSLRPRGMLVLYGQASGPVPPFELRRLNDLGSLFITRPSLAHYT
jgi:NADPH2:quinone reductase